MHWCRPPRWQLVALVGALVLVGVSAEPAPPLAAAPSGPGGAASSPDPASTSPQATRVRFGSPQRGQGTKFGTGVLANVSGVMTATTTFAGLSTGSHANIVSKYLGDGNFATSTSC